MVHSQSVSAGIANFIANEVPSGIINGINTTFTLANSPVVGTVQMTLNGLTQTPGSGLDYILSGSTITFFKAPRINSEILVHYIKL